MPRRSDVQEGRPTDFDDSREFVIPPGTTFEDMGRLMDEFMLGQQVGSTAEERAADYAEKCASDREEYEVRNSVRAARENGMPMTPGKTAILIDGKIVNAPEDDGLPTLPDFNLHAWLEVRSDSDSSAQPMVVDRWFPGFDVVCTSQQVAHTMLRKPAPSVRVELSLLAVVSKALAKTDLSRWVARENTPIVNALAEQRRRKCGTVRIGSLAFGGGDNIMHRKIFCHRGGSWATKHDDFIFRVSVEKRLARNEQERPGSWVSDKVRFEQEATYARSVLQTVGRAVRREEGAPVAPTVFVDLKEVERRACATQQPDKSKTPAAPTYLTPIDDVD